MENLPEPVRDVIVQPSFIRNESKITNLADAMRRAHDNLAFAESEDFNDPDPYGYTQEIENSTGADLLEPNWKAFPDDDRWVKRVNSRARKAAVARMYLMGYPFPKIAEMLEISEITVTRDIENISQEWRRSYLEDMEVAASRDLARLDEMFYKLAAGIELGDTKSIRAGIEIIRERGNILGYRQGVQVDVEQQIREIAISSGMDPDRAVQIAQRVSIRLR